ncbi:MAG TPA: VOC family protein [Kaistia sp.]|nr:VOC family protein [Kaistia sp.]
MAGHGTFYWNELMTRDAARAMDFYTQTLGWRFDSMPMGEFGDYHIAMLGETMVGGIMQIGGPMFEGVPDHWFSYIEVDDLDKRLALLTAAGGTLVREPFEVPGVGNIAIVSIPGGAMQGWMVPAPQA